MAFNFPNLICKFCFHQRSLSFGCCTYPMNHVRLTIDLERQGFLPKVQICDPILIYYTKAIVNNIIEIRVYLWFKINMKVDVHKVQINFTNLDINNIVINEDILDYANLIKLYTHSNKGNKHGRPKIFSTSQKKPKFDWIVVVDKASMAILTTRVINLNWILFKCSNMLNQWVFTISIILNCYVSILTSRLKNLRVDLWDFEKYPYNFVRRFSKFQTIDRCDND